MGSAPAPASRAPVGVIGAGPSDLAVAKKLLARRFDRKVADHEYRTRLLRALRAA